MKSSPAAVVEVGAAAPATDGGRVPLRDRRRSLDVLFAPRTVAVVGATEAAGAVGRALFENLAAGGAGGPVVYPVNPKRGTVFGVTAYPSIAAVPGHVDLAVIATPAPTVPGVIAQCVAAGVTSAVIISAGFREAGTVGAKLEADVRAALRDTGLRVIGPNCLGVMSPHAGLNATFAAGAARPGRVAFLSQSGALCTAILDWSLRENVGFSAFVSVGSMLDVGWGDLIDYFGDDPHTKAIVIYMESVGDARAFLSAAREVALTKPIIVIKPGRTEAAGKAAASHTGALTGSDAVLDAAFRRAGVLRVDTIAELFNMVEILDRQPRPAGPRLTVVTNAGGPAVLATDALITHGGELAALPAETVTALDAVLPAHWSHGNPVDVLGDAGAERYARAITLAAASPASDGLLVVLAPQAMTEATETARALAPLARSLGKPLLASWMGGGTVAEGADVLRAAGVPVFDYPDEAARAFCAMWRYSKALRNLYETPAASPDWPADREAQSRAILDAARDEGRTLLSEYESKRLLAAYGIPTVPTRLATTAAEAVVAAEALGFPVVLKLHSHTVTHKTDVGGVQLDLRSPEQVRRAFADIQQNLLTHRGAGHFLGVTVQPMLARDGYELILGSNVDPQFGPVLLFGSGGQLVEVLDDHALGLPPLNATLARRMMERTRIFAALKGVRGRKPVDLAALEQLLVRFSALVAEQPRIASIEINPLLASAEHLIALDARVILHDASVADACLPRLAIRPYPVQYVTPWAMRDGTAVTIRPIRPEDEPLMVAFHRCLSEATVQMRYGGLASVDARTTHDRLTRICFNDYDREIALVAEHADAATGTREILGVGRLSRLRGRNEAEFALVVADRVQHQGLGVQLLRLLVDVGRREGLARIVGYVRRENGAMRRAAERVGFHARDGSGEGGTDVTVKIELERPREAGACGE